MLINLKNISIKQSNKTLINNVDFHVGDNEFVYIIGKVGSGKSSFLKTIYAELPITEYQEGYSKAEVLDIDLHNLRTKRLPELRRQLGIVFQDFQLLKDRDIEENLRFVLRATGWKKNDIEKRIYDVLEEVDMQEHRHKMPHQLSGGEQQRIAIARALLNHPRIVLADEPTGNLDEETGRRIMQLLKNISTRGTAVVVVTHQTKLLKDFPGIIYCIDGNTINDITGKYYPAINND